MLPTSPLEQDAHEVIDMQVLHDEHTGSFRGIVEARERNERRISF